MQPALSCDASEGGIALVVAQSMAPGVLLALSLEREHGGPPLSALGRVAYCEAVGDGFRVGVEYTWIEATEPTQAMGLHPETAWTLF